LCNLRKNKIQEFRDSGIKTTDDENAFNSLIPQSLDP
jgi:hypothetical protein